MTTLFENSINQNTRCFACGSLVYAVEKKMTTHHIYHNRCFRCRICKRNLTGYSLNEEGDDIYCGNCYRKKQRGDCDSLEFHRAAAEKAQYVHNRHHANQQNPSSNLRQSSLRDVSRHPSLTLRQLERRFLSHKQPNGTNNKSTNETNEKSLTNSHPLTINTNFSTPINLTYFRRDSSLSKDEPTPHFSSLFSPMSSRRTETTITPRITQKTNDIDINDEQPKSITSPTGNTTCGIEFRLNKSNIDLTNVTSSRSRQKSIIVPDLNQNNEQNDGKFHFPDFNIKAIHRRSSSAHHLIHPSRVD
ncbi:unnamed protein product [Rotaria sordida]|uniref:LIM zinc-binding domain-containing protein n=1 Tax=Rotaria sordida TaxID=392033 RepID=A0A818LZL4_9BILA|nr:unnamed protein product [Rotaria sordida]CAF0857962.1 unnamed protein product [Rotaria sordida]CAF0981629.1 unnamed protein product [Rotaria sordida]CAF1006086.1 unnamed protein product [Rotaria sordida]CAF1007110.1 unnamed protein product [Rotaria sordida]